LTASSQTEIEAKARRFAGLRVIAMMKIAKGLLLTAVGLGAFRLINRDLTEIARQITSHFAIDPENHFVRKLLEDAGGVSPEKLRRIGELSLLFAADLYCEGIGLWFNQTWAKYLVLVATSFFIPFAEIPACIRNFSSARHTALAVDLSVLVLNTAIVVYIAQHLWKHRESKEKS
jgi:uncharacterized membrane protein (DUF2068 family)